MEKDGNNSHYPQSPPEGEKAKEKGKPVVVILVGAPGSGKSTFCSEVMSAAARPWVRVCQDTIANGKAGTKVQCINSAANSLKDGKSVFIDRCNLEREQRAEFVKLGGACIDVHAVVLDLPAQLCIARSVKRTGHEGNLQGGRAAAVVNRMLQKKEFPKLNEGLARVTFCQNEKDIKDAINTYRSLSIHDNLISGTFGEKSADAKVQLGIMRFLKKVEDVGNMEVREKDLTTTSCSQSVVAKQDNIENIPYSMDIEKDPETPKAAKSFDQSFGIEQKWDSFPTLAFPSISTADFQFSHEKASDIIVDCVAEFLDKVDSIRLVLVDLSHKSHILSLVRSKASKRNIDTYRFFTFVGDITRLHTQGKLQCSVIANAANWRLKPGGGGVNAAIFDAAGDALEIATKEQADTISPGQSIIVRLPPSSPLYQKERITHVIHVLGPNMNPQRPNYLRNNYTKGCSILREAYLSLFKNFASIYPEERSQKESGSRSAYDSHDDMMLMENDQFLTSDQKSKQEAGYDAAEKTKKFKWFPAEPKENSFNLHDSGGFKNPEVDPSASKNSSNGSKKIQTNKKVADTTKHKWGSWALALHQISMHPEKYKDTVVEASEDFVVINDLYPKAKRHILVISRMLGLDCLADIQKEHLPLLREIHEVGLNWAMKFISSDTSLAFRLGYHSVPSMRQLHLHVISQDFDSACLKNKKHWNSFNTLFFRDSSDVINEVDTFGAPTVHDENLLSVELRCNRCRSVHPNIPRLKSHIAKCNLPFPFSLLQSKCIISSSTTTKPADKCVDTPA